MDNEQLEREPMDDEDMTVDLELEDGSTVTCDIVTILTVEGKDYIILLPQEAAEDAQEDEVWIYRYSENPDDPNEEPVLDYIDDDDEYAKVADAFDEYLDECEFEEMDE